MSSAELHFRIFEQQINVRCDDTHFSELLWANYRAFGERGETADLDYSVERGGSGGFRIRRQDEIVLDQDDDPALPYLFMYGFEKLLTIELQQRRPDLYFVHSAALEQGERVAMIVAESGTGKSTTAWALLSHGFNYLSDELAVLEPVSRLVHPYPHALCLKAPPPGPYPLPGTLVRTQRTLHIPVTELPGRLVRQPRPLGAIFFLQRSAATRRPGFSILSPAQAGARLYANTLNALAHPGNGLQAAVDIAGAVPAYLLEAGDLRATCGLITDLCARM